MTGYRIGSDRLQRLLLELTPLDRAVLARLRQHTYLRTDQITRFEFRDRPSELAATRAAHRTIKRLRLHGLVAVLERRVGGVKRGSTTAVWTLTNTGVRMTHLVAGEPDESRKRLSDPTLIFLRHDIAVADLHLALIEAQAEPDVALVNVAFEPDCWRRYMGPLGAVATLKPDAAAVIEGPAFESQYYFEVDRATERPHRILAKTLQYQEYYRSGEEGRRSKVLPLVVWVVPDEERRGEMTRRLTTANGVNTRLFRVVLMDEIGQLVAEDFEIGSLPNADREGADT